MNSTPSWDWDKIVSQIRDLDSWIFTPFWDTLQKENLMKVLVWICSFPIQSQLCI